MGETKDFARRKAEFGEPSQASPVIIAGSGRHRRPGLPGASPEEDARHEAHLPPDQFPLTVRPEDRDGVAGGSQEAGAMAPPGVPVVPPQDHDPVKDDRPTERRPVDAGRPAPEALGNVEWRVKETGKSLRRRSHRRSKTYDVGIVRLIDAPRNGANAYAPLSTSERYECLMKRLAEIWSAISRRRSAGAAPCAERRKAA